jgi:hypothetical protein
LEAVKRCGPADNAKLAPRQVVAKVAGAPFSLDALAQGVERKKRDFVNPIRLTLTQEDEQLEVELDYHGGLRYPRLERQLMYLICFLLFWLRRFRFYKPMVEVAEPSLRAKLYKLG